MIYIIEHGRYIPRAILLFARLTDAKVTHTSPSGPQVWSAFVRIFTRNCEHMVHGHWSS